MARIIAKNYRLVVDRETIVYVRDNDTMWPPSGHMYHDVWFNHVTCPLGDYVVDIIGYGTCCYAQNEKWWFLLSNDYGRRLDFMGVALYNCRGQEIPYIRENY